MSNRHQQTQAAVLRTARMLFLCLSVVFPLALGQVAKAADGFVEGFADLPLMPGLEPVPDTSVAFDAASGRIVVAFVRGAVPAAGIRAFYVETLGQLGWTQVGENSFQREGESLTLDFTPDGAETLVRFSLLPR